MIKTKILQFFICYETSVFKAREYLASGFCKVLYQRFIKVNFFVNIFITQFLFGFHSIVVSVPNYHIRSLVRFFITRFRPSAKERILFLTVKVRICFLFLTNIRKILVCFTIRGLDGHLDVFTKI